MEKLKGIWICMKKSKSGINYIIGLFYPAGNYCGEYRENVFPPTTPYNQNINITSHEKKTEDDDTIGTSGNFVQNALQVHNKYRIKHHSPPLKLNNELCRIAQQYANYLAQSDSFQHSNNRYKGESLGENL